jgi:hypothetical protein
MTLRKRVDELKKYYPTFVLDYWSTSESGVPQDSEQIWEDDVVDLSEKLLDLLDRAIMGLEELAKLGNAPEYGNSTGNVIAQQTLADIRKQLDGDGDGN